MNKSDIIALTNSNERMQYITGKLKLFKNWVSLKGVSKTIGNDQKFQKYRFRGMLLDILDASLLGNMLVVKAKMSVGRLIRAGEETIRAGQDF